MLDGMYAKLRERTLRANRALSESGLVILTWGNVSEVDRDAGVFAIKPSGVPYGSMTAEDITVVSIETGERVWGAANPSSDTPTHLALYRAWPSVGGICHCHSTCATACAQAAKALPCLGTTHADVFYGEVPVTRTLKAAEVEQSYEASTGDVIVEAFRKIDPEAVPAVLVRQHGPFSWGRDGMEAVEHAMVLEECAKIAQAQVVFGTSDATVFGFGRLDRNLLNKHYARKHGPGGTYGQKK